jgi:hypothetical protein
VAKNVAVEHEFAGEVDGQLMAHGQSATGYMPHYTG